MPASELPEGNAMPGQDHHDDAQPPSRRAVLRGAAGAGAAGVAATALSGLGAPALAAGGSGGSSPRASTAEPATEQTRTADGNAASHAEHSEQVVVHVRDAKTGQIDVFRGTGQLRLHDRDLARHLDRISRG